MVNSGQKTARIAYCLVLFALALVLRAYNSDYGLFHGDERINDSARFLAGELVPTQHFYPPFFNYLNGVALVGLYVFGLASDMWTNTSEFRQAYFTNPTPFYVAARYLTAAIGSLAAPIFFLCAWRTGLGSVASFSVGLTATFFPLGVYMAHIAKGDTALAVACVAVVWAFLMRLEANRTFAWDVVVGLAVALAFGFKQSAILVLGPMAVAMVFVLARYENYTSAFFSLGRALLVLLVALPIMNVGILLDIEGFLAFQNIQTVMSIRGEDGFGAGLPLTFATFGELILGLNPIVLAMSVVTPVWLASRSCQLQFKDALIAIWLANGVSVVAISLIVGTRQPEHLFLANMFLFLLLTAITTLDILCVFARLPRIVMLVTTICGFALLVIGTGVVLKQASSTPVSDELVSFLTTEYPASKIQSAVDLPVKQTKEAQQIEFERIERLGLKYNVEVPEIAEERIITENSEGAMFWVKAPLVFWGLEDDAKQNADYQVQAHAWPVQPDEWVLDNRRALGLDIFVANGSLDELTRGRSTDIASFYQELWDRCEIAQSFDAIKPLFLELELTVFDCSNV